VELENDPARDHRVLAVASAALAAARHGDSQAVVDSVTEFVCSSREGYRDLRLLISLLMRECGTMVSAVSSTTDRVPPIKIAAYGEDGQVLPIDELAPPVRTAMRALLAEVYGDSAAAETQIDLALRNAQPQDVLVVVLQAVWFTKAMAQEFHRRGLHVVDWARAAVE
jgi:hypothetical protein